ncbi:hypothetical protein FBU30_011115 [Linnemannia zychae]|nr:hypothetical protein FBU30_011115 [Linnemannia zychae]
MAHIQHNNNNSIDINPSSTDNDSTSIAHVEEISTENHSGDIPASATVLPPPIPIVTSPTSTETTSGQGSTSGNVVSFSPLPIGRPLGESYPARRIHEFGSSPARPLVYVLETANNAAAGTTSHNDPWVANASITTTGTSGVHFQPQRGGHYSHNHGRHGGSGSGSAAWLATSMPESRFSEFEVVYDDGIRKQRTFSLTTELDEDERSISDDDEGSEHSPLLDYQDAEPSGHDTIHHHLQHPAPPSSNHSTTTPLLNKQHPYYSSSAGADARYSQPSKRRSKSSEYLACASQTVWSYISGKAISLPHKRILKASLAYFCACLLSFTPFFLPYIGMSGHLAATSAVFFNPAKSLGRMVDAVTAGLCAIAFGVFVSIASMLSAIWFNSRDLYIWGHVVSVIVFGGGSTFIIAYAKAYFNRPTVNVGKFDFLPFLFSVI